MEAEKRKRLPDGATPRSQQPDKSDLRGSKPTTLRDGKQVYELKPSGKRGGGCCGVSRSSTPRITAAEREYLEIVRAESGQEVPIEQHEQATQQRKLLEAQSDAIADKLESVGVKAKGDTNLTIIGLLSGETEKLKDYRNLVFIPSIAARKRRKMLKQLEFFMDKHPHCRMWVFTAGDRTPIHGVRDGVSALHRRISKLNYEPFMKSAGVQIVFRSTELGTMKRQDNLPTFHLHVHAIVQMARKLPKAEWSHLLKRVRGWWKHHFKDSQEVHQAREVCKYVVKPSEIEALSGEELKALYEQTFRLHLVQCLGALKEQRKAFEEDDTMPRKEGEQWVVVKNWNAGRGKPTSSGEPSRNSLVCTLAPAAYVTNIKEPAAIIMNYSDKSAVQKERLRRARKAALKGIS